MNDSFLVHISPWLRRVGTLGLLLIAAFTSACPAGTTSNAVTSVGALSVETIAGVQAPKAARWGTLLPKTRQTLAVFMTTWCDSCKRKQPQVLRWATDNKRFARTLFIVSGSPLKEVATMTKQRKIPSPLVLVVNDQKGDIAKRYDIQATPTYILLAPSGKILGRYHNINNVPDAR